MLLRTDLKVPQQIRHHCRNPRCGDKLAEPTENPLDAFCTLSCERTYFHGRCRSCGSRFSPRTRRQVVCPRAKCRYQIKTNPGQFFGPRYHPSQVARQEKKSSAISTAKSAGKTGRGLVIIAGSGVPLDPVNLYNFPANVAALRTTGRPASTLIKRDTFPVNIIGGYRFPGAPTIDLNSDRTAPEAPAIDDSRGSR
jgi:hypothetical protein